MLPMSSTNPSANNTRLAELAHRRPKGFALPADDVVMPDVQRGMMDALRFDVVRESSGGWKAILKTGGSAWIIQRVTSAYLDGLQAGGCVVMPLDAGPTKLAA